MSMHFSEIVFGPIHSRRLGTSLGINLLPNDQKFCNFNCVYCECGWNVPIHGALRFPSVQEFSKALEERLKILKEQGPDPDVITFSGNGEPTLHPQFSQIIDATISLRNIYFPKVRICVLSNAGMIGRKEIVEALMKADKRILKIDSAFASTVDAINQPNSAYNLATTIENLKAFNGQFTLQTMFIRGNHLGKHFDNTTTKELEAWYSLVDELKPQDITVYSLDREAPESDLEKISLDELTEIARPLRERGIDVIVAG